MRIAAESLAANRRLGGVLISSSRNSGWSSVLVDHYRVTPEEQSFETPSTPDQTIVVQFAGEQQLEVYAGGRWRRAVYQAGTIGMTPGGRVDRLRRIVRRSGARPFEKLNLYLPAGWLDAAWQDLRSAGQRSQPPALDALAFSDPLVQQTTIALHRAAREGVSELYAETSAQWLATHLMTRHADFDLGSSALRLETISDGRLSRVAEMMSARFAEPLTLSMLASEAGVSPFHFVRLFRAQTGETPYSALLRIRLETAQTMLDGTDLPLGAIASHCGFASAHALTRAFCRRFAIAPTRWRSQRRGAEA